MVTTILNKAFEKIPDGTSLILHSDKSWQYQHIQYQWMLRKKGFSFMSELLYLQEFESMKHFQQKLIEYLGYHNSRRIKTK